MRMFMMFGFFSDVDRHEGMPLTHLPFLNSSYDVDLWSVEPRL